MPSIGLIHAGDISSRPVSSMTPADWENGNFLIWLLFQVWNWATSPFMLYVWVFAVVALVFYALILKPLYGLPGVRT